MRTFFREVVLTLIFAVVIFFLLQATVQSFIVVGISMKPSLENGQRILVSKATYYLHEPERGDILVFQPPENNQDDYIKRIIALPGDTVEIKENRVYVNGSQLEEDYIKSAPSYKVPEMTVPENRYFVLGDNRNNSNDSHNGWVVPRENIVGKAWLSIWPPDRWGFVSASSPGGQTATASSQ
ncbi:MAG: signal peptidase I [Chloroflexi bacterium]|nr:signal peptidase I [Chloroflexota bacterium]